MNLSAPTQCRFCRVTGEGDTTITLQRRLSLVAWYSRCGPGITRTHNVCCVCPRMHLDDKIRDRVEAYLHQRSYNVMNNRFCQVAYDSGSTLTHSKRLHGGESCCSVVQQPWRTRNKSNDYNSYVMSQYRRKVFI